MDEETQNIIETEDNKIEKSNKTKCKEEYICCPKCKRLVNQKNFDLDDAISAIGSTSVTDKITCPSCGYSGIPIEMNKEDYEKWIKTQ